jgi:hypothetical protein
MVPEGLIPGYSVAQPIQRILLTAILSLPDFNMEFAKNKLNADERVAFVKNMLHDQFGLAVR